MNMESDPLSKFRYGIHSTSFQILNGLRNGARDLGLVWPRPNVAAQGQGGPDYLEAPELPGTRRGLGSLGALRG